RNTTVWWLMMGAALLVVAARCSIAFTIGCYDQAIQLEAAHRLVQGLGLTSRVFGTFHPDISQPPTANYLTWWPPGLSLLMAALLSLKIPLVLALKALYGSATLAGWWGWATLLSQLLTSPLRVGVLNLPIHWLLAVIFPLFYTPIWSGTDLFLWAVIPFIVLLLFQPRSNRYWHHLPTRDHHFPTRNIVAIGLLVGCTYIIRYAALFLIPTIFVWLLQRERFQIRRVLQLFGIFILSCLPFLAAIALYNRLASQAVGGLPPYIETNIVGNFARYAPRLLTSAPTISAIFGITNLQPYADKLGFFRPLVGIVFWVTVALLPLALLQATANRFRHQDISATRCLLVALAILPIMLALFLGACTLLGSYNFLSDYRYYIPAILPTIVVLYTIASHTLADLRRHRSFLKLCYSGLLVIFLAYNLVYRPVGALLMNRGRDFLGFPLFSTLGEIRYFSNDVIIEHKETLARIQQLRQLQPQAQVFMHSACFVYNNANWFVPMYMTPSYWQTAYTSQPISIIWVFFDNICTGDCIPQPVFSKLAAQESFKQVYTSAHEHTRIILVTLPAGYRFSD
ncbi:MAG: hypothetical protein NZ772_11465, partial [Cyanobacteria bacterium]|nr:hypothetical protein [Cyanobacteriota bacterium]MDW8202055.1 hypothetical protein [Cyanobacteriota bacterium SKYGB_h_bin112]